MKPTYKASNGDITISIAGKEIMAVKAIEYEAPEWAKDIDDVMQKHVQHVRQKEEELIKSILRQVLQREPTIEDAKDCHRLYHQGEPLNYDFAWKNMVLGHVRFNLNGPPAKEFSKI